MTETEREYLLFALAVLDNEPGAHKIVADLLEEQGRIGHAQWARARKGGSRKRLEFAVSLLPAEVAVRLGCDFVEHVIEECEEAWPLRRSVYYYEHVLEEIRTWLVDASLDMPADLNAVRIIGGQAADLADPEFMAILRSAQSHLHGAIHLLDEIRVMNEPWQIRHVQHQRGRVVDEIRKLIRKLNNSDLYRTEPVEPGWFHRVVSRMGIGSNEVTTLGQRNHAELNWQIAHAREVIEELLHASGPA